MRRACGGRVTKRSRADVAKTTELEREVRRHAKAATVWQFRALQAEERLKALTAGTAPDTSIPRQNAPGLAEGSDASRARRLWRRLTGTGWA